MLSVPVDGAPQPLLEIDESLPAHQVADLRRIHVLAVDLTSWAAGPPNVRRQRRARQARDELHDLAHWMGATRARVEGLAANLLAVQSVGDRNVGAGSVLD